MASVYVIQTGRTTWDEQTRIESAPGAPLTATGRQDVADAARELAALSISAIYACGGEAEQQTAELVAEAADAKVRTSEELRELDYGLWQGLTREEIKRRQPKLYRQWTDSPASVRPPGGETLEEARRRLCKAVRDIVKRHKNGRALLVLRPVAFALLRCMARHEGIGRLWQNSGEGCCWQVLEADPADWDGS